MPEEITGEKCNVQRLHVCHRFSSLLTMLQSPESGGFAEWEPPVPKPYLEILNPSEFFADIVVEKEHVECTASIIQALVAFKNLHQGYREKEINVYVAKGVQYLVGTQKPNGSWYGYSGICFLYGTYLVQSGIISVGKTYSNSEAVCNAVQFYLSTQNEEGG